MTHKSRVIKFSQNERYCSKCKKVKNEKEFVSSTLKSIENTSPIMCKECANVKNKITIDLSQNEKYCVGCKSVKDKKNFNKNQEWCKESHSNSMKEYYEKNKDNHKLVTKENYKRKQVRTVCESGRTISLVSLKDHLKTKIHKDMLELIQQLKK